MINVYPWQITLLRILHILRATMLHTYMSVSQPIILHILLNTSFPKIFTRSIRLVRFKIPYISTLKKIVKALRAIFEIR